MVILELSMGAALRKSIVVLEGPDGSGKTTLANALVEAGWAYEHSGPPEKPSLEHYLDMLRRHGGPVVLDRWHGGSYVYGIVFRGMDDLTSYERWTLEGAAMAQGATLVYTCPDASSIDKSLERGPDNVDAAIYEVPEKRQAVRQYYTEFMSKVTQLRVVHYDFTVPLAMESLVNDLDRTRSFFDRYALLPAHIPALGNIVNPRYIFVGDEPSGRPKVLQAAKRFAPSDPVKQQRFTKLAFSAADYYDKVPFKQCSSGRYLHWALTVGKLKLSDYCIFNSRQLEGAEVHDFLPWNEDFWWRPGWQTADVVALGNAASQRLDAANIKHRTVSHPSFAKRFHYRDVDGYAKQLRGEA